MEAVRLLLALVT
jgi:hypothetical protein